MSLTNTFCKGNSSETGGFSLYCVQFKGYESKIKKNVKNIKVLFQPFNILMEFYHPKTIISAANKENLNVSHNHSYFFFSYWAVFKHEIHSVFGVVCSFVKVVCCTKGSHAAVSLFTNN